MRALKDFYKELNKHYSSTEIFIKLFSAIMGCIGGIMILLGIWKFLVDVLGENILK
jgi:hypothetical protein